MAVKHCAKLHITTGNRDCCSLWEYQQVATAQHLSPYLNECSTDPPRYEMFY